MTNEPPKNTRPLVAVIGGGPAGLAAAAVLAGHADVHLFEAMPSPGRKFLLAGRSGLNLTHAEDFERFLERFGAARARLEPALCAFPPDGIRNWAAGLGVATFVGSSGRVFPNSMKASPLLRAWLAQLRNAGVQVHVRHRWQGWNADGTLVFDSPAGPKAIRAPATVLALGGASWPRLGSSGAWTAGLAERGIAVHALRPANCGFDVTWSAHFATRFAGTPVKSVALAFGTQTLRGDLVPTMYGIEGSPVYSFAAALRDAIEADGVARLILDLAPEHTLEQLTTALARPRGKSSLANHLRKAAGMSQVKVALLRETLEPGAFADPATLAARIKSLPLLLERPRPIAEAISSAGGVVLDELDERFMLRKLPGVFAAGEMLDWEAPTGGYLLSACLATGRWAGNSALDWIRGLRTGG